MSEYTVWNPSNQPTELEVLLRQMPADQAIHHIEDTDAALIRDGFKIVDISPYLTTPKRISKTVQFFDIQSMKAYLNKFADDYSMMSFSVSEDMLSCVIDYHSPEEPSWCEHMATFKLEKSEEFESIINLSRPRPQVEFAEIIEDISPFVAVPASAVMVDLARNMTVRASKVVTSVNVVGTGQKSISYEEASVPETKIPDRIEFRLPMYRNMDSPISLIARMDLNIKDRGLQVALKFIGIQRSVDKAKKGVIEAIAAEFPARTVYQVK